MKRLANILRRARAAFDANHTYENAVALQRAQRIHVLKRREVIRPVD